MCLAVSGRRVLVLPLLLAALLTGAPAMASCPAQERGREAVLDAVLAGDAERFAGLIDAAALAARVIGGFPDDDEYRKTVPGMIERDRAVLAARFVASLRNFQKTPVAQPATRSDVAIVRRQGVQLGEGIDYLLFDLGRDGCVTDWSSLQLGSPVSAMMRQTLLLGRNDAGLLARAFGIQQVDQQQEQQMRALLDGLRKSDSAAALRALEGMKALARESFELSMLRASLFDADTPDHRQALEDIAERFGDDQRTQFMLIDHHFQQEDYAAAVRAIDAVQKRVGPDEESEFLRAIALQLLERHDEAVLAFRRMVRLAPARADTHENLIAALAGLGRSAEAVKAIEAAEQRGIHFAEDVMRADPVYAELIVSAEYAAYRARRVAD